MARRHCPPLLNGSLDRDGGEAEGTPEGVDLSFGVGRVVELARPVLVAEEHRLKDAPSLIERAAAARVMIPVADDVEVAPVVGRLEERFAHPAKVRHLDDEVPAGAQDARELLPHGALLGEGQVLQHVLGQDRSHRSVGERQRRRVDVGHHAGGARGTVDVDPARENFRAAADVQLRFGNGSER